MYTGDVGAYELHVSGPACAAPLQFAFPSGLPTVMPPNAVLRFPVQITSTTGIQSVVPGTEAVYYRYDRAPFRKAPLIDQGGGLYFAELPPRRAEDTKVEFFISAQVDQGAHVTFPAGGADAPLTVCVDVTTTPIFETDFETDAGFTVSSTASDGQWDRGVPRNCGRGDPPTDFDGSGQCWLTDNGNCLSDVDGGETVLTSPPLNISGAANPFVTYAYWFERFGRLLARGGPTGGGPVDPGARADDEHDLASLWLPCGGLCDSRWGDSGSFHGRRRAIEHRR
jgi:hypothetical protein